MNRRRTLQRLGLLGASLALPALPARGESPSGRHATIGLVYPMSSAGHFPQYERAFFARLAELGWATERNLQVERRFADGRTDILPGLMREMVTRPVDAIITVGTPAATAARNATTTIPIIVAAMGDPLGTGLVTSLAHPGGNLTGVSVLNAETMPGKWLEILREIVPRLRTVAALYNPDSPLGELQNKGLRAAVSGTDTKTLFLPVRTSDELPLAIRRAHERAQALIVYPDPLFVDHRRQIIALTEQRRLPALYGLGDFAADGGLVAYAVDQTERWRTAATYVDKVLRGTNPGDIPVDQPTTFRLTVNLRTAKALGISIPESILVRADEVIR